MKEAQALGVDHHITFHGKVEELQLKSLLLGCDLFVMLSGTTSSGDVEGFGIAILEANALGIPAIGALGCGIEDAIQQGKSGYLIDAKDSKAFLKAIETLLKDKESFAKQAKDWAKQHDWNIVGERYVEVIND